MNEQTIRQVIGNMRASQAEKDALLKQALAGNPHALFALNGVRHRQQISHA